MNEDTYLDEDEITLKDIVLKVKEFSSELVRRWIWILGLSFILALVFYFNARLTPTEYQSELVFMINEEKGGGGGGISSLVSQFGISVGGGGGEYNKEKIITLSSSGKIINPVLLDSLEVNGENDLIGNHLIRLYELHEQWEDSNNQELKNFYFTSDSIDNFAITENSALKSCYRLITGTKNSPALSSCSYQEDSGILSITTQSISEELAQGLTDKIYHNLSTFYIKQQTEPQQKSFESIKIKADSLNTLIRSKEFELASLRDGNNNVYLQKFKLRESRLQREIPTYASQYAVLIQNVENADFILKNKTPFFQVIDYPFFPLSTISSNAKKSAFLGGIGGVFLAALIIIIRKVFLDAINE